MSRLTNIELLKMAVIELKFMELTDKRDDFFILQAASSEAIVSLSYVISYLEKKPKKHRSTFADYLAHDNEKEEK